MNKEVHPQPSTKPIAASSGPGRRRAWRTWVAATVLLGLFMWSLPWIVAHSPLRNKVLEIVFADLNGSVTARSAALGWFAPIVLYDVEVHSSTGERAISAPLVQGDKPLLAILFGWSELGSFRCERPVCDVRLRPDGSNVEEILAAWLAGDGTSLEGIAAGLEVSDGTATISVDGRQQQWTLSDLSLALSLPRHWSNPMSLRLSAGAPEVAAPAHVDLDLQMHYREVAGGPAVSEGMLTLTTVETPLQWVEPIVQRMLPDAQVAGLLTSDLSFNWGAGDGPAPEIAVEGNISTQHLMATAPWLGSDRLQLDQLEMPLQLFWSGEAVHIQRLDADCDLGTASMTATVDLHGGLRDALMHSAYEMQAEIDLARLAAVLPNTLGIHSGTQIESGSASVRLKSEPDARWHGNLETSELVARRSGRTFSWERPIAATFAAHQSDSELVIDKLQCESSFLVVEASGSLNGFQASAEYDLQRLAAEVGRFVDLGDLDLEGRGAATLQVVNTPERGFQAEGNAELQGFRMAAPGRRASGEETIVARLAATGPADLRRFDQISTAELRIESGEDVLDCRLTPTDSEPEEVHRRVLEVQLAGAAERWAPRLGILVGGFENLQLGGQIELSSEVRISEAAVEVPAARLALRQFRCKGYGLDINEPGVQIKASGRWDRFERRLQLDEARAALGAASIETHAASLLIPEQGEPELDAEIRLTGDLARLHGWTHGPPARKEFTLGGEAIARFNLRRKREGIDAELVATINEFSFGRPQGPSWREPSLQIRGSAEYDRATGVVALKQIKMSGDTLQCDAQGHITDSNGKRRLALNGTLGYDMEQFAHAFSAYLGADVQFSGSGSSPFRIEGPIGTSANHRRTDEVSSADATTNGGSQQQTWTAEGSLSWTSATGYGFALGPATAKARMADGSLRFDPIRTTLQGGDLAVQPTFRLTPGPAELYLGPGAAARRVRITPETCDRVLQYIAPVLAGITEANGEFSIDLAECRVPLDDTARADVTGTLVLDEVEVGPGALVRELGVLLDRPTIARFPRGTVVAFRMVGGRVYHRGLTLEFPELTVQVSGWVGLDHAISLVVEMPVPPKWLGKGALAESLGKQRIRLPITGSLERPRLDQLALQRAMAETAGSTAEDFLRGELRKQIDRLFDPKN